MYRQKMAFKSKLDSFVPGLIILFLKPLQILPKKIFFFWFGFPYAPDHILFYYSDLQFAERPKDFAKRVENGGIINYFSTPKLKFRWTDITLILEAI